MKTFLLKSHFLTIVFLIANLFFAEVAFGQAAITSDQPDYQPGTIATFTGVGFQPGETVNFQVLHSNIYPNDTADGAHDPWIVIADVNGKFVTTWQVSATHCIGKILRATAVGQSSGENVWHEFTDPLITSTTTGGNWNSGSTWIGGSVPLSTDDVAIAVGATVTVTDNRSASSILITGGSTDTKILINSGIILSVSGNVTINSPGSNARTNEINVGSGILNIGGNLTVNGTANGGGINNRLGRLTVSSGSVDVNGNITTNNAGSNSLISFSGAGALNIAGNWFNNGTFNASTSTVTFDGTSQSIGGSSTTAFNNLVLSGGTKTFGAARTISGNLSINSGAIADLGTFSHTASTLTLGGFASPSGTWGSTSSVPLASHTNNTYFAATTGKVTIANGSCTNPSAPIAGANTHVYSGTTKTAIVNVGSGETVDWYANATGTVSSVIPSGTNVGTYAAWAEARNTTTSCKSATRTLVTVTIDKAALTVTADAGQTKVYGGVEPTLTYTITGFVNGDDEADLDTPVSIARAAGENVDNYTITPSAAVDANYTISFPTAQFAITKATLTVTADAGQTKVYGGVEPTLTYTITGFVNGDDEADLDTPVSIARAVGEDVGNYTITPSAAVDANYIISFPTAQFAITKVALTVTADAGQTKVYGGVEPTLTYTITGFVNGDDEADLDTPVSIARAVGEDVGNYTITPSAAVDANYTTSFPTAQFAITKAALTVTADAGQTKVYGGVEPTLTYTIIGFVNGDDEADLDTPVSIARAVGEDVGNYTITPSAAVDANYTISFPTAQFAITKATLTVTANTGQTKVYGATDPTLTYTITGFVNGDDEADLDTPVSIARAVGEDVGNYTITPSAAVDANYTISFPTAQFAITKATLTVTADAGQTKVYGGVEPTLTYTIIGFVNGDDEADLDTAVAITRATGEDVGSYIITPSAGADANYTVGFVTSNFAITKANLTATANNQTKVYGAANPSLTFTYSGWVNGVETIDTPPSITTTVDGTTIVGNYPDAITLSGGLDNNYTFNLVAGDFEVTKAVLTATADNKTKYCGQANPALTFQYSGWVNGVETIDTPLIIATTVNATTSAGIYPGSITLSGGLDNNYSFSFVAGTLTVYSVSIDASASSAPVALGSVATLSATVTSTVSGNLSGIPVIFTLDNGNGTPITYPAVSTDSNGLATYSVSGLSVEVYKIMVVAGSGCASSTAYLAVYDPNGGFVTGGGWINSPLGAYTANPALTGKANFGFNAKYKKGSTQVDGNTEFQFQTGNLNFSSSSHDAMSLVIAGAQAIYKGKGTINGISGFSFMVSAIDGNKKSPIVPDKFRIKIWNTLNGVIIYDNQIGAADNADAITSLGGGSIVIHEVKKNGTAKAVIVEETPEIVPFAITAYPNPSTQYFIIEIKGGTTEKTEVIVYDILGRMVKHIQNSDSKEIKFGEELSSGSYIAIINQGTQQKTVRLIKQ